MTIQDNDSTGPSSREWVEQERAHIQAEADAHDASIVPGTREWIKWERRRLIEEARAFDKSKDRMGSKVKADYYAYRDSRRRAATDAENAIYAVEDAAAVEDATPWMEKYVEAQRADRTAYGQGRVDMVMETLGRGGAPMRQLLTMAEQAEASGANDPEAAFWDAVNVVSLESDIVRLPALLTRNDGATLIYAGREHSLHGEPGSGKSWLALMGAKESILKGGRVVWWDYEDTADTIARRGAMLGFPQVEDTESFRHVGPQMDDVEYRISGARMWLSKAQNPVYNLVVIDAAESSGAPSDGASISEWWEQRVTPWRTLTPRPCVLFLDHVPKQREDRPRGPIGSTHKMGRLDGAALMASGIPWNQERPGKVLIRLDKDRHGQLPGLVNQTIAVVVGDYTMTDSGRAFGYRIEAPDPAEAQGRTGKPPADDLSIPLLDAITAKGAEGVTGLRAVQALIKGGSNPIRDALEDLVAGGLVARQSAGRLGYRYTAASIQVSETDHE